MKQNSRRAFTLIELLAVVAIIVVLLAILLPAIQAARAAAVRVECAAKLKQLGVATHGYHDVFKRFPRQDHSLSWLFHLLPYVEQGAVQKLDQPTTVGTLPNGNPIIFTDATRWQAFAVNIPAFLCPAAPVLAAGGDATTHYVGVAGRESWADTDGVFGGEPVSIPQITRGTSNTIDGGGASLR
jgi:prepilin-type N-terminal cleavage/methylation domain-containing protein